MKLLLGIASEAEVSDVLAEKLEREREKIIGSENNRKDFELLTGGYISGFLGHIFRAPSSSLGRGNRNGLDTEPLV